MFNIKSYKEAGSVKEAIQLLQENRQARLIAGGTDVLVKLHKGNGQFHHLIDIHKIAELDFGVVNLCCLRVIWCKGSSRPPFSPGSTTSQRRKVS